MLRLRTLLALTALALLGLPAYADDGDTQRVTKRIDLRRYAVPPAAPGSRLPVPSDMIAKGADQGDASIWSLDHSEDSRTWLPFEDPTLEEHAVSADTLVELLRSSVSHRAALAEALDIEHVGEALTLSGPREAVAAVAANVEWLLAGLVPSLRVDAVLTGAAIGAEPRLRAMGGLRLWPGRWTRVYLQESAVACTPVWDIEVAQESTIMDPIPVSVAEGRELYVRYHPGETVALVEVWSGDVEHLELLRDDLSGIRNIPEANGLGVVSYPRSAVNRVFTSLLVPAGEGSRREIRWTNEGRVMQLSLRFGTSSATSPVLDRAPRNGLLLLRAGASANSLEFGARARSTDLWNERIGTQLYAAAEGYEKRGRTFEFTVSPVDGGSIFFIDAPSEELTRVRELIRRAEAGMATAGVHLEALTVPEPAWRRLVLDGTLRVGEAVSAEVLQTLKDAGASTGESFTSQALVGAPVAFRMGHCRPGIIDYDPELAQQSAGLRPVTSARFHGLFGELLVRPTKAGRAVRVRGAYCTANSSPKGVEISIRPPLSMTGTAQAVEPKAGKHLVALPVLTGTHAAINREVELPEGTNGPALVHAHVQGDEVVVILVSLRD